MPETNFRTMVRRECETFFGALEGLPAKERSNEAQEFPRLAWKVIDDDSIPYAKIESGKPKEANFLVMAEIQVSENITAIDDAIDHVLELLLRRAMTYTPAKTYQASPLKGEVLEIEYRGGHPRVKTDTESGRVSGPVYAVFNVKCSVWKYE